MIQPLSTLSHSFSSLWWAVCIAHKRNNLCPILHPQEWLGREREGWLQRGGKPQHPSLLGKDLVLTADRATRIFFLILEVYFLTVSVSDTSQKGLWEKYKWYFEHFINGAVSSQWFSDSQDYRMVRNRTELGDLFPIRVRQMGNKGAQAKANNLMGNQNQNVEKAKIKSRQTKSFPVRSFSPPRKGVCSTCCYYFSVFTNNQPKKC